MSRKLFLIFLIFVFLFSTVFAAGVEDDLHLNIQVLDSGEVTTGTFDFVFNITTDSGCSNVVYSDSETLTTDSRGIISYYLQSVDLSYSDQLYLCHYRDGALINVSQIARTPYAFRAKYVNVSGIQVDQNLDLSGFNFTADYLFGDGSFLSNLNVSEIDLSDYIPYTGSLANVVLGDYNFSVGSSDLFVNSNLGRVGIGTDSPLDLLHINSNGVVSKGLSIYDGATLVASLHDASSAGKQGILKLYDDGTEDIRLYVGGDSWLNGGNVGIGTTSPGAKLEIKNSENYGIALDVIYSSSDSPLFRVGQSNTNSVITQYTPGGVAVNRFQTSGDTYFNGGNVGIGTTSPASILHVNGSAIINGTLNMDSNKITSLANGTVVTDAVTLGQLQAINNSVTGDYVPYTGATQDVDLGSYDIKAGNFKYDDSNQSILVGTTTGNTLNQVTGFGYGAGSGNTGEVGTFVGRYSGANNLGNYLTASGYNSGSSNSADYVSAFGYAAGESNQGSQLTASGFRSGQNNLGSYVTASGFYSAYLNNGSGVTAMGYKSAYKNAGSYSTGLGYGTLENNTGASVVAIGYQAGLNNTVANQFIVQQANINAVPLIQGDFASGNVGIGTTTPQNKLDIEGGAVIGATYSGTNTAPTNGLLVEGNVGIGTTAPQRELHVNGDILSNATINATGDICIEGGNCLGDMSAESGNVSGTGVANRAAFWTDTDMLSYDGNFTWDNTNKRLGIGTESPSELLTLAKAQADTTFAFESYSSFSGDLGTMSFRKSNSDILGTKTTTTNGQYLGILNFQGVNSANSFANGAYVLAIQDGTAGTYVPTRLQFTTYSSSASNSNQLVLDSTGYVGIGETSPDNKLHINSGASNIVSKFESTDQFAYIHLIDNGGSALLGVDGTDMFIADNGGVSKMLIETSTGNVGIGTTTPQNELNVIGDGNFTGTMYIGGASITTEANGDVNVW